MAAIELGTWHTRAGYVGDVACTRSVRSIALRSAAGETDLHTILASASGRHCGDEEGGTSPDPIQLWSLRSFQQETETHINYLRFLKNRVLGCASLDDPLTLVVPELWHERLDVMRGIFELIFEDGEITNALYCARPSVCWALASGKVSAIVLDAGHSHTSVAAVFDGYALRHTISASSVGGAAVTAEFAATTGALLTSLLAAQPPEAPVRVADGTAAALLLREKHAADVKHVWGFVSTGKPHAGTPAVPAPPPLKAPDGTTLTLSTERRCGPYEVFFGGGGTAINGSDRQNAGALNVADMLVSCKHRVDPEWQVRTVHHILAGGTSMARGFVERTADALRQRDAAYFRFERDGGLARAKSVAGAWIGASMVAASSSFDPLWVTRAEWEEEGESVLYCKLFY